MESLVIYINVISITSFTGGTVKRVIDKLLRAIIIRNESKEIKCMIENNF